MEPLVVAIYLASIFLTAAVFLALVRVLIGPTLPNRMMAVDLVAMVVIGLMAVSAIRSEQEVYLEAIIVWAILSFVGTVAFVNYLEGRDLE